MFDILPRELQSVAVRAVEVGSRTLLVIERVSSDGASSGSTITRELESREVLFKKWSTELFWCYIVKVQLIMAI